MSKKISHAADLLGLSHLTVSAVQEVADLAEELHLAIIRQAPDFVAKPLGTGTSLVYRSVRGVARLAGSGVAGLLTRLQPLLGEQKDWPGREALLAAINGVLGDHLAQSANPLAIPMQCRRDGRPWTPADAVSGRILVLVHGLCMNDVQWRRNGHDHGALLEQKHGYSSVYLHYNSGRHISENGRAFADQLEALLAQWPVPVQELVLLGHSMGGLVSRSACHYGAEAGHQWRRHLRKMVFLGSPHQGAPLERGGNWFHLITGMNRYSAPFTRLARMRSAGITDLRHGSVLDEDWCGRDRFAHGQALPRTLDLPQDVACYALAASLGKDASGLAGRVAGDGLVPLESALASQLELAPSRRAVVYRTNHMELLDSAAVYATLEQWLSSPGERDG